MVSKEVVERRYKWYLGSSLLRGRRLIYGNLVLVDFEGNPHNMGGTDKVWWKDNTIYAQWEVDTPEDIAHIYVEDKTGRNACRPANWKKGEHLSITMKMGQNA
jgi:hypothetical protein